MALNKYTSYYHEDHNSVRQSSITLKASRDIFVSQEMLNASGTQDVNWLHTHGNYSQNRFYPSNQINSENVSKLSLFLKLKTDVIAPIQSSPLIVNGVI